MPKWKRGTDTSDSEKPSGRPSGPDHEDLDSQEDDSDLNHEHHETNRDRHLNNVVEIMYTSMAREDWTRARKAWNILIRMPGFDIRRRDLWRVGAEMLMREHDPDAENSPADDSSSTCSPFSERGFARARRYYESLIMRYPYTSRNPHGFNATQIYPSFFSIWMFEVSDHSKRARQALRSADSSDVVIDDDDDDDDELVSTGADTTALAHIRQTELEQALLIAKRMDRLLEDPPYDAMSGLLGTRGMLALWLATLQRELGGLINQGVELRKPILLAFNVVEDMQSGAEGEERRALEVFGKIQSSGKPLPDLASRFLAQHG